MKRFLLRQFALAALVLCSGSMLAIGMKEGAGTPQQQQPPPTSTEPGNGENPTPAPTPPPKPQFFAGTVTTVDSEHIIVSRTLVGKAPETRTFLIRAKTKLSKSVRPKQRVTVRYQHLPEGDVALEVQVRLQHPPRNS
jgi:hypothetical protein